MEIYNEIRERLFPPLVAFIRVLDCFNHFRYHGRGGVSFADHLLYGLVEASEGFLDGCVLRFTLDEYSDVFERWLDVAQRFVRLTPSKESFDIVGLGLEDFVGIRDSLL